jgi:hypothetical protein
MRPSFADTIARVRRMRDGIDGADVSDVFEVSPWLQMNVMLEDGAGLEEPSLRAYQLLADGDLDAAVEEARDSLPYADEILRLAAASDGASDTIVTAALALGPDQAIDGSTIWAALGLAARHDVPLDALFDRADAVLDDDAPMARAFLVAIDSPQFDAETAESLLVGASPQIRGHALSMGVVALGNDAPAEWRDSAVRLLFPTERPYFRN